MGVELQEVHPLERDALWRLKQLCIHDYSESDRFEIGPEGNFNYRWFDAYFREAERYPFFIRIGEQLSGFVMVRESNGEEDWDFQIAEFFILRRYRRMGIGRDAARQVLRMFPGVWGISFNDENTPAANFWRSVAGQFEQVLLQRDPGYENRGRYLITTGGGAANRVPGTDRTGQPKIPHSHSYGSVSGAPADRAESGSGEDKPE